jgi:hypothetical protein
LLNLNKKNLHKKLHKNNIRMIINIKGAMVEAEADKENTCSLIDTALE